ncbi:thioredoxin [candidate division KSB1 bacterium 4484_188]|nr:MAG: thioredoxin [candidate division KSB1 bacterium 4484_188]HFE64272.1 thioredoxin [Caldithrix sp.]
MSEPIKVTDQNFQSEVLESPVPVLIDFWAPWCAPCRIVAPAVESIAQEFSGVLKVGKLNTDENQMTAMEYRIMGIPTLGIFVNGQMVDQIVGAVPKQHIVEKLKYYLQGAAVKN